MFDDDFDVSEDKMTAFNLCRMKKDIDIDEEWNFFTM